MECSCGSWSLEKGLALLGAIVPAASALASWANATVRAKQADGENLAPWILQIAAALNVIAVNGDKSLQFVKAAKAAKAKS